MFRSILLKPSTLKEVPSPSIKGAGSELSYNKKDLKKLLNLGTFETTDVVFKWYIWKYNKTIYSTASPSFAVRLSTPPVSLWSCFNNSWLGFNCFLPLIRAHFCTNKIIIFNIIIIFFFFNIRPLEKLTKRVVKNTFAKDMKRFLDRNQYTSSVTKNKANTAWKVGSRRVYIPVYKFSSSFQEHWAPQLGALHVRLLTTLSNNLFYQNYFL